MKYIYFYFFIFTLLGIIPPVHAAEAQKRTMVVVKKKKPLSLSFTRSAEEITEALELEQRIAQRNHAHNLKIKEEATGAHTLLAQWRTAALADPNVAIAEKKAIAQLMKEQKKQKEAATVVVQNAPMAELIDCAAKEKEIFNLLRHHLINTNEELFVKSFKMCDPETQKKLIAMPCTNSHQAVKTRNFLPHQHEYRNEECDLLWHDDHGIISSRDTTNAHDHAIAYNDNYKRSLLHYAAIFCFKESIDELLRAGAAHRLVFDARSALPLHWTLKAYNKGAAESLLNDLEDLLVTVKHKDTALCCLASEAYTSENPSNLIAIQNQMRAIIARMKAESKYSKADIDKEVKKALAIIISNDELYDNNTINLLTENMVDLLGEILKETDILGLITYHAKRSYEEEIIEEMREQMRSIVERLMKDTKYSSGAILKSLDAALKTAQDKQYNVVEVVKSDLQKYKSLVTFRKADEVVNAKKHVSHPVLLPTKERLSPTQEIKKQEEALQQQKKAAKAKRILEAQQRAYQAEKEAQKVLLEKTRESSERFAALAQQKAQEKELLTKKQEEASDVKSASKNNAAQLAQNEAEHQRLLALAFADNTKVGNAGKPKEKPQVKKNKSKAQLKREAKAAKAAQPAVATLKKEEDYGPRYDKSVLDRERRAEKEAIEKVNEKLIAQRKLREELEKSEKEKQKAALEAQEKARQAQTAIELSQKREQERSAAEIAEKARLNAIAFEKIRIKQHRIANKKQEKEQLEQERKDEQEKRRQLEISAYFLKITAPYLVNQQNHHDGQSTQPFQF